MQVCRHQRLLEVHRCYVGSQDKDIVQPDLCCILSTYITLYFSATSSRIQSVLKSALEAEDKSGTEAGVEVSSEERGHRQRILRKVWKRQIDTYYRIT